MGINDKKLLELAKESIGKDESILEYILKFIRDNNAFEELGEDCHVQLIEMLSLVKEMTTKAQLIETIVECPNYISDSVLFDEYISMLG